MTSVAVLGATGNLGSQVVRQVLHRGWALSVAVRSPTRLPREVVEGAKVFIADLHDVDINELARFVKGHDVLVCCAGLVTEGVKFVSLVDKVISAVESVQPSRRPVCWFMAGVAVLDLDALGRRGVDLPKVKDTYWPHRANLERLQRSTLDWRLLCPGPMVDQPAVGTERLRISVDTLPTPFPAFARFLPRPFLLPMFAAKIPAMIIPYADAAMVMLNDISPGAATSRKRVGIALPVGMRGKKSQWAAKPRDAA